MGAHARRQQRLVAVTHSRVGHQDALLGRASSRQTLRAERIKPLPGSVDHRHVDMRNPRRRRIGRGQWPALGLGMAVDGHIGE
jgi:hypothetical protein